MNSAILLIVVTMNDVVFVEYRGEKNREESAAQAEALRDAQGAGSTG